MCARTCSCMCSICVAVFVVTVIGAGAVVVTVAAITVAVAAVTASGFAAVEFTNESAAFPLINFDCTILFSPSSSGYRSRAFPSFYPASVCSIVASGRGILFRLAKYPFVNYQYCIFLVH